MCQASEKGRTPHVQRILSRSKYCPKNKKGNRSEFERPLNTLPGWHWMAWTASMLLLMITNKKHGCHSKVHQLVRSVNCKIDELLPSSRMWQTLSSIPVFFLTCLPTRLRLTTRQEYFQQTECNTQP